MSRKANEDTELITSFAANLDKFIIDNKYTNESFGKLLGISEAAVRKYRKGEILPSHTQMKKILFIMHQRYHEIFGFEDPKDSE